MSGRNHTPNKPLNNNTGTWICNVCTFENVTNKNACEVCNSIKGTKADVGKSNVFNQKDTFQKPQEIHDEPRYKNNDGKCFLCGNGDPIQRKPCKACQYRVFCSACSKRYHDHPHRTWHVDRSNDVTFPRDVQIIVGKLNDEFKNQCEDSKIIVESGNSLLDELSKDKQCIIRKLGEAQNLIKERSNSYEQLKQKQPKLLSKAITTKREGFVADRERQWPYKEEELLTNFKEERKDQMKRIAKNLRGKLQNKMETAGSKVHKSSEKDIDIRKTDDELELKLEGMQIMWEAREAFEWDAHRLKVKAQWDMETNELWTMDAEKYMTENANKDWDTIDNMVKTVTTKINKKLEKCKTFFEENRISSNPLNHTNVYQSIEGRVNKLATIFQELDDAMRSAYETFQQQKVKWENLNDNNKEINADLVKKRIECDMLQHKYWEEKGDWTRQSETLKKEAAKSQSLLESTTVQKESIRIKFEGLEKELQAQKARHEEEQKNWKSARQQFIKEQDNLKKVADEWRKKYESEIDEWKDEWEALDSSECKLLKEKEELLKKIEILERENKKLIKELPSQEIIKNPPEKEADDSLDTGVMPENVNDSSIIDPVHDSIKQDSATTVQEQNDFRQETNGVNAGIKGMLTRQIKPQRSEEEPSTSKESQIDDAAFDNPKQTTLLATSTDRKPLPSETYHDPYKPTSTGITPVGIPTFALEKPKKHLSPDPVEFNILVIGECYTQSIPKASIPIIINALATCISFDALRTSDDPPAALIDFDIEQRQGKTYFTFSDEVLNRQEFSFAVPTLDGRICRFIRMMHNSPWYKPGLSKLEIEEMLQILSLKKQMHCIIVAHCPTDMQFLPAKLLSLLHKSAAKNLIFIEDISTEKSIIQAQLSKITGMEFDPQVFHRYKEFREDYTHWVTAHRQGNKAELKRTRHIWDASAMKWQTALLGRMLADVPPHDSQVSVVVMKVAMLSKAVFRTVLNKLRTNADLQQQISQHQKQIERSHPTNPQKQHLTNQMSRLTNDYEISRQSILNILATAIKVDNYLKDNAIMSEQSTLMEKIENSFESYHQTLSIGLKDYLRNILDYYRDLRFDSIDEIINLYKEIEAWKSI